MNDPQIIVNGPDPGLVPGDETEALLDVEWSGAVAKGATIKFVTSKSTNTEDGVDLSAEFIINNNLAPIMSESFGLCELQLSYARQPVLQHSLGTGGGPGHHRPSFHRRQRLR